MVPDCSTDSSPEVLEYVDLQPAIQTPAAMMNDHPKRVVELMAPVTGSIQAGDPAGSTLPTILGIGGRPETFNGKLAA